MGTVIFNEPADCLPRPDFTKNQKLLFPFIFCGNVSLLNNTRSIFSSPHSNFVPGHHIYTGCIYQLLYMGQAFLRGYSLHNYVGDGCHVVWYIFAIGVHWILFWFPQSRLRATCTNKSNPQAGAHADLVHEPCALHPDGRGTPLRSLLYWALFHLLCCLWKPILLSIWLFVLSFCHSGCVLQSNQHCHGVFPIVLR